jgi:hypothetical protein
MKAMPHVWVSSVNGDLLHATEIRQINVSGGLHAVLVGGSQFVLAETGTAQVSGPVALKLVAAIEAAEVCGGASVLRVVHEDDEWTVATEQLGSSRES